MQFHKVGSYKLQILTQKSKHNVKCSLYVDFIIINNNKELMRANFIFFLGFLCHNNGVIQTQLQQPKKSYGTKYWDQESN